MEIVEPIQPANENIPIWNYDSVFKTKKVISKDRARFVRRGITTLEIGVIGVEVLNKKH